MPKATKSSAWGATPEPTHEEITTSSQDKHSSSDQEPDPEITLHLLDSHNQSQACSCHTLRVPGWTVNDELYHRFLKWCLKYENILECKLATLPECQQCKKVIAWSGDVGMD